MKLTYTIELDVKRESGRNVSRADISAQVIRHLLGPTEDFLEHELYDSFDAEYAIDIEVFAHENSVPAS